MVQFGLTTSPPAPYAVQDSRRSPKPQLKGHQTHELFHMQHFPVRQAQTFKKVGQQPWLACPKSRRLSMGFQSEGALVCLKDPNATGKWPCMMTSRTHVLEQAENVECASAAKPLGALPALKERLHGKVLVLSAEGLDVEDLAWRIA